MIYIHKLTDMNSKNADIEVVQIIRDLKSHVRFPLSADVLKKIVYEYYVSSMQLEAMERSLELIPYAISQLQHLKSLSRPEFELVNIDRVIKNLESLPDRLKNTIAFHSAVFAWQEQFCVEGAELLSALPLATDSLSKSKYNDKIGAFFLRLTGRNDLTFDERSLVNEGSIEAIHSIIRVLPQGYLFKFTLEDELRKRTFDQIKSRIPSDLLKQSETVHTHLLAIGKGIDAAYEGNLRLVEWAVVFYALVRMAVQ